MKNSSMKNFSLREIYNNKKTKSEYTMILRVREIAHVNLLACVPACVPAIARVSESTGNNLSQFLFYS